MSVAFSISGQTYYVACANLYMLLYSLRKKFFGDFKIGGSSENLIFRSPYSLIHFGIVCESAKYLNEVTLLSLERFSP